MWDYLSWGITLSRILEVVLWILEIASIDLRDGTHFICVALCSM